MTPKDLSQAIERMQGMPAAERVRELLNYDAETGIFTWRVNRGGPAKAGRIAGCLSRHAGGPRWKISVDSRLYYRYQIAWLWVHGEWPRRELDHIDRDPLNDRIDNLREATHAENVRNRMVPANKSGLRGVYFSGDHKRSKPWTAKFKINGKQRYLGRFSTREEASAAYEAATKAAHGEFHYSGEL